MSKKNVEAIYPLSPSQQGMLLETLADAAAGRYIEQSVWRLSGKLNVAALERAWQRAVARHAVLRTCFVWKNQAEPLQVVLRQVQLPIAREDWQACAADRQQAQLADFLAADRRQGFNLARAPLLRLTLIQTAPQDYQLIWTFHHILLDGWCAPLIAKDVLADYDALQQGQEVPLTPGPAYASYISWLRRQNLSEAETFWRQALQGFSQPTPLGRETAATASPAAAASNYGEQQARLTTLVTAALQALAQQHRLTLSNVVQGVWALLLSRYSSSDDVVFGATVSGRPPDLAGVETMIGFFINTVPLRFRVVPAASFWDWLPEMQTHQLAQRAYEYCSAGQIQQWSELSGRTPLYESILVFENYPVDFAALRTSGLTIDIPGARVIGAQTKYALTMLVTPGTELAFQLIYDRRRFDESSLPLTLKHLEILLKALLTASKQPLAALRDLIPVEQIPRVYPKTPLPLRGKGEEAGQAWPPQTATEQRLAAIWTEILGLEQIRREDNFFALGGHSLLATQLLSRLNVTFNINLSLQDLFEHSTLAGLAMLIETIHQVAQDQQAAQQVSAAAEEEEGRI